MNVEKAETYTVREAKYGNGTFYYTDCGNRMYSIRGKLAYHRKLCPKCFMKGKYVTLYARGSKEAREYWDKKGRDKELENTLIYDDEKDEFVNYYDFLG